MLASKSKQGESERRAFLFLHSLSASLARACDVTDQLDWRGLQSSPDKLLQAWLSRDLDGEQKGMRQTRFEIEKVSQVSQSG